MSPVQPWSKQAIVTPWSVQHVARVVQPWERHATSAFPLIANARIWTPSNFSERYLSFLGARLEVEALKNKTPTYIDALDTITAFRDFGLVIVDKDGSVWFGPYQSLRSATATGSRIDLQSFTPLPDLSFGSAKAPCDNSQFTPLDGTHLICVRKFNDWNNGISAVAGSYPEAIFNSGDVGQIAEFLLTSGGVNDGTEMSFDAWVETRDTLLNLHHTILHDIMNVERPFTLHDSGYVPKAFASAPEKTPDEKLAELRAGKSLGVSTIDRMRTASYLLSYEVLTKKPAWIDLKNEVTGQKAMLGMLAIGLLFGNFGQVQQQDVLVETNNFLLLPDASKTFDTCGEGHVWNASSHQCLFLLPTVGEGAAFFLDAVSLPANASLQQALLAGDVGKLADALIRTGHLQPLPASDELWSKVAAGLQVGLAEAASATKVTNPWVVSNFQPSFGSIEETPPAGYEEEAPKKTEWRKWLIGGVAVGLLAGVVYYGSKSRQDESPERVSNPTPEDADLAKNLANATKDKDPNVRYQAAWNENTPSFALARLVNDDDEDVRAALAENKRISKDVRFKLADDASSRVRSKLARRDDLTPGTFEKLADVAYKNDEFDALLALAENEDTPAKVLDLLSRHKFDQIRFKVAENQSTGSETLARLARDKDNAIRAKIAHNDALPKAIRDAAKKPYVQYEGFSNLTLDEKVRSKNEFARVEAAKDPDLTPEMFNKLAKDRSGNVAGTLMFHPKLTYSALVILSNRADPWIRSQAIDALKRRDEQSETYLGYPTPEDVQESLRDVMDEGGFPEGEYERFAYLSRLVAYVHNAFESKDFEAAARLVFWASEALPDDYFAYFMERIVFAALALDGARMGEAGEIPSETWKAFVRALDHYIANLPDEAEGPTIEDILDHGRMLKELGDRELGGELPHLIVKGEGDRVMFPEKESMRYNLHKRLVALAATAALSGGTGAMAGALNVLRWYSDFAPLDQTALLFQDMLATFRREGKAEALLKAINADAKLKATSQVVASFTHMARGERLRNPASPRSRYKFASLSKIMPHVAEAKRLGVSEVARSSSGFLTAYRRAGGDPKKLSDAWIAKRNGFIARHMVQAKANREPLHSRDGYSRRGLALLMWAYDRI